MSKLNIDRTNPDAITAFTIGRESEPLAASSPPARPDGWLDGEIDLTAFALAHPDCDVKAVLRGFADWILAAPKTHP